ncbi:MAG: DUF3999 domain-containing protein [Mediterranea sp.]|jgi:hypothetical protein|nr:DUF3999 domain-containing protein [Mediterranea sp.]
MKTIKLLCLPLLILLWGAAANAQPGYRASLPTVPTDGFYAIDLPQEVLGAASPNMKDIRILDAQGVEVAYQPRQDIMSRKSSEWTPMPMEVRAYPHRTELIITPDTLPLSSFILRAKNADLQRKEAVLTGSDDKQHWYGVRGRFDLNALGRGEGTETLFDLSFPRTDYHYYKLSVNDSTTSPYHFIDAGRVKVESYYQQYLLEVPFVQHLKQEKNTSEIRLDFQHRYQLCRLDFYVSAPHYYHRNLSVKTDEHLAYVSLSNEGGLPQSIPITLYTDTVSLSIYNGDDRPLTIDSIKAYIHKVYLIAELKQGMRYSLTYEDPRAKMPQYDLTFTQQLPDNLPHISVGDIETLQRIVVAPTPDPQWLTFLKTYGVWIVILLVMAQLLYMVYKMLKKE